MNRVPKTSAPLPKNSAIATRSLSLHCACVLSSMTDVWVACVLHF
jgi:hypothetical protein